MFLIQDIAAEKVAFSNKSGVTGVCWDRRQNKWQAYINIDAVQVSLGFFKEKEHAITARKEAEKRFGVPKVGGRCLLPGQKSAREGYWRSYRANNPEKVKNANRESLRRRKERDPIGVMLMEAKRRARERNIEFNLDASNLTLPNLCEVCGVTMKTFTGQKFKSDAVSLDRLDNSKGYIYGNVRFICLECNRWKSDCTESWRFRAIADYIDRNSNTN